MNKENLYQVLDIDCPEDFQYFENYSAYIECPDLFQIEDICELFSNVDKDLVSEIIHNYFDEIMEAIPDESSELLTILDNESKCLIGLLRNGENISTFAEEQERFREYYSINENVEVSDVSSGEKYMTSICDAVFIARSEKFDNSEHRYNFNDCLDYKIEEYVMSFSDIINSYSEEDYNND